MTATLCDMNPKTVLAATALAVLPLGACSSPAVTAKAVPAVTVRHYAGNCQQQAQKWLKGTGSAGFSAIGGDLAKLGAAVSLLSSDAATGTVPGSDVAGISADAGVLRADAGAAKADPPPSCMPFADKYVEPAATDYLKTAADAATAMVLFREHRIRAAGNEMKLIRPLIADANADSKKFTA